MAHGDRGRGDSFSIPGALDRMSLQRMSTTSDQLARGMAAASGRAGGTTGSAGARDAPAGHGRRK